MNGWCSTSIGALYLWVFCSHRGIQNILKRVTHTLRNTSATSLKTRVSTVSILSLAAHHLGQGLRDGRLAGE